MVVVVVELLVCESVEDSGLFLEDVLDFVLSGLWCWWDDGVDFWFDESDVVEGFCEGVDDFCVEGFGEGCYASWEGDGEDEGGGSVVVWWDVDVHGVALFGLVVCGAVGVWVNSLCLFHSCW